MKIQMHYLFKKRGGFTLIEVMVVIVILGILAMIIVPNIINRPEQAREMKAKQDILAIQSALDLYQLDNGMYPTTEQGLKALVQEPTTEPLPLEWEQGGYLRRLPIDPWGVSYQYQNDEDQIIIFSFGPKGKNGNSKIYNIDSDKSIH